MATAYENKTPKVVIAALDTVAECLRYALPNVCTLLLEVPEGYSSCNS